MIGCLSGVTSAVQTQSVNYTDMTVPVASAEFSDVRWIQLDTDTEVPSHNTVICSDPELKNGTIKKVIKTVTTKG